VAAVDPRDDPASVVAAERVMLELWTVLAGFADAKGGPTAGYSAAY
jgi:hypothetical protein